MSDTDGINPDIVRRDFIDAYAQKWGCDKKYAESLLRHVEIAAVEAEIEAAQTVRAAAENEGLHTTAWYEGWDDAIERVTPADA